MKRSCLFCFCLALIALLPALPAQACGIPVFVYAIERWEPEFFDLEVLHDKPLSPEQRKAVEALQLPGANVGARAIEFPPAGEPSLRALWEAKGSPALPWVILRSPGAQADEALWTGRMEQAPAILDSPMSRRIVKHLTEADAVVWVLVRSGDRQKDQQAEELLAAELKKHEGPAQIEADEDQPPTTLNVTYPIVTLSRDDAAEAGLVLQFLKLASMEHDNKVPDGPIIVPIFGRGRALAAFAGEQINAGDIRRACEFLIGNCSCEIKEMNPGVDLLMTADWENLLARRPARIAVAPSATLKETVMQQFPPFDPQAELINSKPPAMVTGHAHSYYLDIDGRAMLWIGIITCAAAAGLSGLLVFRQRRRSNRV